MAGTCGRRPAGSIDNAMSARVTVMIFALVVAVGGVVGARPWSQANDPLALADLRADPALALRMPEAEELAEVGGEDTVGIDGSRPAFAGHIYGTAATSAEVYAFYERELGRLGGDLRRRHTRVAPPSLRTASTARARSRSDSRSRTRPPRSSPRSTADGRTPRSSTRGSSPRIRRPCALDLGPDLGADHDGAAGTTARSG